jgi:TPP-dependent pyruvate/acetoin dehydrogenase alpha subunit
MVTKSREQSTKTSAKKSPARQTQPATPVKTVSSNGSSPSSQETLRRLYASLLRARMAQERAAESSADNYELAIGHEAVIAGPTADLTSEDTIAASPRNLAALVARGLPLNELLAPATFVTPYSITNTSLPEDPFVVGTGIALAHKLAKKQRVVVAFCPQDSTALEMWNETLKFAGEHKLSILFVIKNGVADQQASSQHAPHLEDFTFMTRDYGFPGIIVDGQDVVAVFRATQESIHRARNGSGPTLIDCRTDSTRDPLAYMEHYMRKRNVWDDAWKQQVEAQIQSEMGTKRLGVPSLRS